MKSFLVRLLVKSILIGLIGFSLYELSLQFMFSYLNQNKYSPRLTIVNFAGPFILTALILLLAGQRILFQKMLALKISSNFIIKIFLTLLLSLLLVWQIWYIMTLYKMQDNSDHSNKVTELLPMATGLFVTFVFMAATIRRRHAS